MSNKFTNRVRQFSRELRSMVRSRAALVSFSLLIAGAYVVSVGITEDGQVTITAQEARK